MKNEDFIKRLDECLNAKNDLIPNEVVGGENCWHCKELEQHIKGGRGYCHLHAFEIKHRIAELIKCNDFDER